MTTFSPAKTDSILDELEGIARNGDPDYRFYPYLLDAVEALLEPTGVVITTAQSPPMLLMRRGAASDSDIAELNSQSIRSVTDGLSSNSPETSSNSDTSNNTDESGKRQTSRWFSCEIPRNNPSLALAVRMTTEVSQQQASRIRNLLNAFGELAEVRELVVESSRRSGLVRSVLPRTAEISSSTSLAGADRIFVETLRESMQADRVALFDQGRMISCSGTSQIDPASQVVQHLEQIISSLSSTSHPQWVERDTQIIASENQGVALYVPLGMNAQGSQSDSHGDAQCDPKQAHHDLPQYRLLIEWGSKVGVVDRVQGLAMVMPVIQQTWIQQRRWLSVPEKTRVRAIKRTGSDSNAKAKRQSVIPRSLVALATGALAIGIAFIPYPLEISVEGVLEPVEQRFIHSPTDSLIDSLFVNDGDSVKLSQPLLQLLSPSLNIQIEEVLGQIRAFDEKRDGLRIAVNQLSSNTSDVASQIRLSSELKLIEAQRAQADDKLRFLEKERTDLLIRSPLDGVVIASDIERELRNRPLRRGETLFRLAATDGPWQLRLSIPDRESGYVEQKLQEGPIAIRWGLESSAGHKQSATIDSVRSEVHWHPTRGAHRSAIASLEINQMDRPALNATTYARIPCGLEPLWYVWSRPLVEYLQKRFWLPTQHSTAINPDSKELQR
jgi:hypothetical protein